MITVSASADPPESMISGGRDDLTQLAALVGSGGSLETATSLDPSPYDVCLVAISVEVVDEGATEVSVGWSRNRLDITGDTRNLEVFAANIDDIVSESPIGTHHHFEYFPGHFYLSPESFPLVVELTE